MVQNVRLLSGLSVLAAVVERGSFTGAGDLLGLSPSGVSRAITRLEDAIGVLLLQRTTRSVRLTSEGARLYELSSPHLEGIEEAAELAAGTAASVRGQLRVSVNAIFARHILAPRLPEFLQRHPDLTTTIVQQRDGDDLIADSIDAAIRFGPQPDSSMSARLILTTRVVTVASPAYVARRGRPRAPTDLAAHECLQFIDVFSRRAFDWELQGNGRTVPVSTSGKLIFTDPDTMVAACQAGAGIAQVLAMGIQPLIESGSLVNLFPDWPGETFPLYAIRPSRRLAPGKVTAFLEFCEVIARPSQGTR